jgi:hypothetical protein
MTGQPWRKTSRTISFSADPEKETDRNFFQDFIPNPGDEIEEAYEQDGN